MSRKAARRAERGPSLTRRLLAGATTVLLALGMSVGGAGAAFATPPADKDNPNKAEYWEGVYSATPGIECFKVDSSAIGEYEWGSIVAVGDTTAVSLKQPSAAGTFWRALIVKGGSDNSGDGKGNAIYEYPTVGTLYYAPDNASDSAAGVSHWIVCSGTASAASADLTVVAPTCELGSPAITTSAFKGVTGASGNIVSDGSSNGQFSVVFTAANGFLFPSDFKGADDNLSYVVTNSGKTLTITGTLAGPNAALCDSDDDAAAADVAVVAPTCELGSPAITTSAFKGVTGASGDIVSDGSSNGQFSVVFTAAEGFLFPSDFEGADDNLTYEVTNGGKTLTITGTLAGPDTSACPPVATAAVTVVEANCFSATTFTIVENGTALATFGLPISNPDGTVSIVATAIAPALFAEGEFTQAQGVVNELRTTKTFTVKRDPQLPGDDPLCVRGLGSVELAFTAPTCEIAESLNIDGFDFVNTRVKEGTLVQGNGTFQVTFEMTTAGVFDTNKKATEFAKDGRSVTFVYSEDFRELTLSGVLAGPDTKACITLELIDPFAYTDDCILGASYTLEFVDGLSYLVSINGAKPVKVLSEGQSSRTFTVQPGDAVSAVPVTAPGYVLAENQPSPLSHTFKVYGEGECDFPTLANWPANVTPTNEVCTALGVTSGSLTVQLSTGPSENPNPVRYFINYGQPGQQELVTATTSLPAGTYVVTAVVAKQGDSVNNSGAQATFTRTVGAVDTSTCDLTTLALTGVSPMANGLGVLALLVTMAGIGLVVRRRAMV